MNRFSRAETVEEVVFQAIGAGSVCWENPNGAGEFDSTLARAVGDDAMARLRELGVPKITPGARTVPAGDFECRQ